MGSGKLSVIISSVRHEWYFVKNIRPGSNLDSEAGYGFVRIQVLGAEGKNSMVQEVAKIVKSFYRLVYTKALDPFLFL
jgi:hypothetical protein